MIATLTWNDNADNEAFQTILASNSPTGPFTTVMTVAANVTTAEVTIPDVLLNGPIYWQVTAGNSAGNSLPTKTVPALLSQNGRFPTKHFLKLRRDLSEAGLSRPVVNVSQGTLAVSASLGTNGCSALQPDGRTLVVGLFAADVFDPETGTSTRVASYNDATGKLLNYAPIASPEGKLYTLLDFVFREHTPTGWREVGAIPFEQRDLFTGTTQFSFGMLADGDLLYLFRTATTDLYVQCRVDVQTGVITCKNVTIPLGFKTTQSRLYRLLENGNILIVTGNASVTYNYAIVEYNPETEESIISPIPWSINNVHAAEVIGDRLVLFAHSTAPTVRKPSQYWIVPFTPGQPVDLSMPCIEDVRFYDTRFAHTLVTYAGQFVFFNIRSEAARGPSIGVIDPRTGSVEEYFTDIPDATFDAIMPSIRVACKDGFMLFASKNWRRFTLAAPEGVDVGSLTTVYV